MSALHVVVVVVVRAIGWVRGKWRGTWRLCLLPICGRSSPSVQRGTREPQQ
jgi:hypothetical protein